MGIEDDLFGLFGTDIVSSDVSAIGVIPIEFRPVVAQGASVPAGWP